ncbi:MAG: glycosyltransferase family 87 protein [Bdellovibrionota bacterium]|jgi:hypothetical protein
MKILYRFLLVTASLLVCILIAEKRYLESVQMGIMDFTQYYSAAELWWNGSNPYEPTSLFEVEQEVNPSLTEVIRMWNPPLIFPLIALFPLLPFYYAATLWFVLSIVIFLIATDLTLRWHPHETDLVTPQLRIAGLLVFTFLPLYTCLQFGQISPLFLCGIILYLRHLRFPSRKYSAVIAGLGLTLTVIKPHLFLFLYLFEGFRSLRTQNWRVLQVFILSVTMLSVISTLILPDVWLYYWQALQEPPIYFHSASLGSWLQYFMGSQSSFLQMIPMLIGLCAGFVWLFKLDSKQLNAYECALLSLTYSLALAPYGWSFDFCVLLPPYLWVVLTGFYRNSAQHRALASILILTNIGGLIIIRELQYYLWYPWLTLLVFWWCLQRRYSKTGDSREIHTTFGT